MSESTSSTQTSGPSRVDDESETRGGLEPEAFQRELIVVTSAVLILGIVGGSCLGMKIHRAEKAQSQTNQPQQSAETPSAPASEGSAAGTVSE